MSKNTLRYTMAAMATAFTAQGAFAQEADNKEPIVSGTARIHASTLADDKIRFTELPELSADFRISDTISLATSVNLISPQGETVLSDPGASKARIDDFFLKFKSGDATVNVGQIEFLMDRTFGEIWTASGVGYIAPQVIDEAAFAQHTVARVAGAQVEYTKDIGGSNKLYLSAGAGKQGGGDALQHMGMARITHAFEDGASIAGTIQHLSRDVGGAVNEQGTFVMVQAAKPLNEQFAIRGDIEAGAISNVGGSRGQNGTLVGVRGFLDWKPTDTFSGYLGIGAFKEAAGGSFEAIEGGVAYKLTDKITVHGGVGYANDSWAKGVSTIAGLTVGF